MCFGGNPKTPTPPPPPAPSPIPLPEVASPTANNEAQQKQLQMMRYGLISTVKTSPQGLLNSSNNQGKKTLGA